MKTDRTTWKTWSKWGALILFVIICAGVIYGLITINEIKSQRETGFSEAKHTVLDQTDVVEVVSIDVFYEAMSYYIVFGATSAGKEKIVFLPFEGKKDKTVVDQDDIMPKKTIKQEWKQNCSDCHLISVQAAMIETKPLWEITYKDGQDRHVLDYLSMESGKRIEQWKFKHHF